MAVLVRIDGWDPVVDAAVSLFAASHDEPEVCHSNGGTWWPVISKLPTLRYDLFDGAFAGQITAPSSSLTLQVEPWPDFGRYILADARIRVTTGSAAEGWTLRFDGRVSAQPKIRGGVADVAFAVDDRWLDSALLVTYAGTTGAEGPAALKGQAKPLALGAPRYVAGKLIDSVNSVFQVSAYGAVQGFEAALERLARFGAPIADYATYAALVAADSPAGRWATAKAVGMARFGAPPTGQVSFLLQGDAAGPDGWARKPGDLIRRIALLSGGAGKIDNASLDALDLARPYNLSIEVAEQTTARQLIQEIAASVNAVAGVSWTGQLFVAPVAIGVPTVTLAADGSSLPLVRSVEQIETAAPWRKLAIGAERSWTVHPLSEIAFAAQLIEVGLYDAATTYREGNIVNLADGARYVFVSVTPAAGSAPTRSNPLWQQLGVAVVTGNTNHFGDDTPIDPKFDDLWIKANGDAFRYAPVGGYLLIGGSQVLIGGRPVAMTLEGEWQVTTLTGAIELASGNTYFITGPGDPNPTAKKAGDFWFSKVTGVVLRWDGDSWEYTADRTDQVVKAIDGVKPIPIAAGSDGVTTTPLPKTLRLRALSGGVDRSAQAAWTLGTLPGGIAATINTTTDRGLVTLTRADSSGNIPVTVTHEGGLVQSAAVAVVRTVAAATGSDGSGGGGTGSTYVSAFAWADPFSGTHVAITAILTVTSSATGTLTYRAGAGFYGQSGTSGADVAIKAAYRLAGTSDPWADFAPEATAFPSFEEYVPGYVNLPEGTKTGLTVSTNYDVVLFARLAGPQHATYWAGDQIFVVQQ